MEPKNKKKIVVSGTLIATSFTALITWASNEVKKIPVIEEKVRTIERTQEKIEGKIDAIYYHLLKKDE